MIEIDLKAGDIYTWQNYPLSMDKAKPQRWFLYLGYQSIDAVVYHITTTTQYQHYNRDGNRNKNNFFKIPAGMGGLPKESILDLSFFEIVREALLNKSKADIGKTGTLSQDYVNKFLKHLKIDRHIINKVKKDICGYLRNAGFKVA
jgi:hypothetical protein